MDTAHDMLAERLNNEPVVFRGYTDSELTMAIRVAAVVCIPIGVTVGVAAGSLPIGLGGALAGILVCIMYGAVVLQRWKRGRPDFYFQQRLRIRLHAVGVGQCRLFRSYGVMSLGRDRHE